MADLVVGIDQLGEAAAEAVANAAVEQVRARITAGLSYMQTKIEEEAPRLTGAFAASVRPYVGEPGATWSRERTGPDAGPSEVEAAMKRWQPGQEVGLATDAPYGRKLIFHPRGVEKGNRRRNRHKTKPYTSKVAPGWVDRIVLEGNRVMEGSGE